MNDNHVNKQEDKDFDRIHANVVRTAEISMEMMQDFIPNFKDYSSERLQNVRDRDRDIDALHDIIRHDVMQAISKWQPMADDLRLLFAYINITNSIERIGDHIRGNAKKLMNIGEDNMQHIAVHCMGLQNLSVLIEDILSKTYDDLTHKKTEYVYNILEKDEEIDDYYYHFLNTASSSVKDNLDIIGDLPDILFMAKNLERIGDHATNIGEMLLFAINKEGLRMRHKDFLMQSDN